MLKKESTSNRALFLLLSVRPVLQGRERCSKLKLRLSKRRNNPPILDKRVKASLLLAPIPKTANLLISKILLISLSYRGPNGNVARSILYAVFDR